jgi:hypothetical protein
LGNPIRAGKVVWLTIFTAIFSGYNRRSR